jgi:NRPS condensation-like uncharacterized protein
VNVAALQQSFDELVRRHEVLRVRFESRAGQPVQVIDPSRPFDLAVKDLSGLAAEVREGRAQDLTREHVLERFDLSRGPLLRVALIKLAEQEHILLVTMHHIISDGWSTGILLRELGLLYEAYVAGRRSPLAPLEVQYADYSVWQRDWLQGEVLDKQLAY